MKRHEIERILKAAGFHFEKNGGTHAHWKLGNHRITLPFGREIERRLSKYIQIQIKRIQRGASTTGAIIQ